MSNYDEYDLYEVDDFSDDSLVGYALKQMEAAGEYADEPGISDDPGVNEVNRKQVEADFTDYKRTLKCHHCKRSFIDNPDSCRFSLRSNSSEEYDVAYKIYMDHELTEIQNEVTRFAVPVCTSCRAERW